MISRRNIFTLLAAVTIAASAHATVVAKYNFGTTTVPSLTSSDGDLNSLASAITAGTGFTAVLPPDTTSGNPAPDLNVDSGTAPSSQALAITGNDYYSFTLTPVSGTVSLNTLSFDIAASGNVVGSYFVQAAIGAGSFSQVGSVFTSTSTFTTKTISLSAPQFQNLTLPVTFRIYIFDNKNGGMNDLLDNITLDAVPEPSTWAMMGLGAGLLAVVQRFRKRR